jgi:hypothetical protein
VSPAWPVMPGVPAAGHLARGYWHPGRAPGCPKCGDTGTELAARAGRVFDTAVAARWSLGTLREGGAQALRQATIDLALGGPEHALRRVVAGYNSGPTGADLADGCIRAARQARRDGGLA